MKKWILIIVFVAISAVVFNFSAIASEASDPAPNSGDGISDGSGMDAPSGDDGNPESGGPAPNSGDGISDGSGMDGANGNDGPDGDSGE